MWLFMLILCAWAPLGQGYEVQLPSGSESLTGFWPGDLSVSESNRCSCAITATHVYQIKNGQVAVSQTLSSNTTASGVVYDPASQAMWLGVATQDGTITWLKTDMNCGSEFVRKTGYPLNHFPTTKWSTVVMERDGDGGINTPYFIGNNEIIKFSYSLDRPTLNYTRGLPWNYPNAKFQTVVGLGSALPFDGTNFPTLAIARQVSDGVNHTGEVLLIDTITQRVAFRYFPNIRAWKSGKTASGAVCAIALIDPEDPGDDGYLLGFLPTRSQPKSIRFSWTSSRRWSTGVTWSKVDQDTVEGVFVVGKEPPGETFVTLQFVRLNAKTGDFSLTRSVNVPVSERVWIPDTPSFISAPVDAHATNKLLWFTVQNSKGAVVVVIPSPTAVMESESDRETNGEDRDNHKNHNEHNKHFSPFQKTFPFTTPRVGAVLCHETDTPCNTLSPTNICGTSCCQTFRPAGKHKFVTGCCKDCNLGVCTGNPGKCQH